MLTIMKWSNTVFLQRALVDLIQISCGSNIMKNGLFFGFLLELNFKQSKLTRLNFSKALFAEVSLLCTQFMLSLLKFQEGMVSNHSFLLAGFLKVVFWSQSCIFLNFELNKLLFL
jgi:hypothetical protein